MWICLRLDSLQLCIFWGFSLAISLNLTRVSLACWMLSHCERSLGLQAARRLIARSASLLYPASSSLCSSRAARWLKSRHSEDRLIVSCMMQSASISCKISVRSISSWIIFNKKACRGFQCNLAPISSIKMLIYYDEH